VSEIEADVDALRRFATSEEGQYFDRESLHEGPPGAKKAREKRKVRDQVIEYVAAFANADGGPWFSGSKTTARYRDARIQATRWRRFFAPPRRGSRDLNALVGW